MNKNRVDELDKGKGSKRLYNYVRVCPICKRYHRTRTRRTKTKCFECSNKNKNNNSYEILKGY